MNGITLDMNTILFSFLSTGMIRELSKLVKLNKKADAQQKNARNYMQGYLFAQILKNSDSF